MKKIRGPYIVTLYLSMSSCAFSSFVPLCPCSYPWFFSDDRSFEEYWCALKLGYEIEINHSWTNPPQLMIILFDRVKNM